MNSYFARKQLLIFAALPREISHEWFALKSVVSLPSKSISTVISNMGYAALAQ
jgi:hypothetical protein